MDHLSINDVERLYQHGTWNRQQVVEYLREWNGNGKHITRAVLCDERIRNFDPETNHFYKHLYAEFGVTL